MFPAAKDSKSAVDMLTKPAPEAPEMEGGDINSEVAELVSKYGADAVRAALDAAAPME